MSRGPVNLRWIMGTHAVHEALKVHPHWVTELVVMEGKKNDDDPLIKLAQSNRVSIKQKGPKFFNQMGDGHQGVAAALNQRPQWDADGVFERPESLVVFLDGITDPHNLGAMLRTAWLLGVEALFIPKNRAVDLTPVVCKVACGGAEHVPVESCHFQSQLQWFKDQGYWVYGLSEKGKTLLPKIKTPEKAVLIVGAEGEGMRSSTTNFCDELLAIPQVNSGSSYNASVAFALTAYEFTRNRWLRS